MLVNNFTAHKNRDFYFYKETQQRWFLSSPQGLFTICLINILFHKTLFLFRSSFTLDLIYCVISPSACLLFLLFTDIILHLTLVAVCCMNKVMWCVMCGVLFSSVNVSDFPLWVQTLGYKHFLRGHSGSAESGSLISAPAQTWRFTSVTTSSADGVLTEWRPAGRFLP